MLVLTDNLLNRASIDTLAGLRSEIINSYAQSKNSHWASSKADGGKRKLTSRRIAREDYPFTSKVVDSLISQKIIKDYFLTLQNAQTSLSSDKDNFLYTDFSIELGFDLLTKNVPQFLDDTKILGLKVNPMNIKTSSVYPLIRDAARDMEARYGVTPALPSLHFSILKHQTYIPIHTDDSSKIISVMLYLASPDQNNNVDLGTSFWYPYNLDDQIYDNDGRKGYDNKKIQSIIRKEFLEQRTPFVNGSIVSFLKTSTSWHSFLYDGPNLGPRVSLNLNIHSLL